MEIPDFRTITAALATIGMAAQYFGFTMPNANRADENGALAVANRESNFKARDDLRVCIAAKDELYERLIDP